MRTVAPLAVAALLGSCAANPSPRTLIDAQRPLSAREVAAVLAASRQAIAGRTFRVVSPSGGSGTEVLVGRDGRLLLTRSSSAVIGGIVGGIGSDATIVRPPPQVFTTIAEYTRAPARRCDGSIVPGELVIYYEAERDSSPPQWRVTARASTARSDDAALAMLRSTEVASGERAQVHGRPARMLTSPWHEPVDARAHPPALTGDPAPNVAGERPPDAAVQLLWIDTASLLPVAWEVSKRGSRLFGYDLAYEDITIRPPTNAQKPRCIP